MLDLRKNQLERIPAQLAACTKLKLLNLGDNRKIGDIPADVLAKCVELEELHLYKNKLEAIPDEIGNCTSLKNLTLSSNNVKTLPDSISQCLALEELYLTNNPKFSAVPCVHGRPH